MRRTLYKYFLVMSMLVAMCAAPVVTVCAQTPDKKEVRSGNRKFKRGDFRNAEIDYRKGLLKDSLSLAANYNLANTLYKMQDYDGAGNALGTVSGNTAAGSDYYYNLGDVALQKEDYAAAVEAFKQSLLLNPEDIEAKENYIYAKKKLQDQQNQNQQNQGGGGQDNQDQDQDQNQNENQDQNSDQPQDQNQDQQDNQDRNQQGGEEPKISPQQAQQMLKAIQAKEKDTQDKVNKEKADLMKSKQREKNW